MDSWVAQLGILGVFLAVVLLPVLAIYGLAVFLWDMVKIVIEAIDLARGERDQ